MKNTEIKAIAPLWSYRHMQGFHFLKTPTALLFAAVVLLLSCVAPVVAQGKNIVILAPHPDDEALCCAGIIYNALQQGNNVTIVVVTNGDFYQGVPVGLQREGETVAGMAVLGLNEQKIIFMGYGDEALQGLYQSTSPTTVITSPEGQTQTYATRGLGGVSYHQYLTGVPGPYNRQTILGDMEAILQNLQPSDVYTTGLWDDHPDHVSTFNFLVEALLDLRRQGVPLSVKVHETLIHAPCGSCGTPVNPNYLWPGGGTGINPTFSPTQPYAQPYYLANVWPNGNNTPYSWNQIERDPVPASMQDPNQTTNLKAQIIANYKSQDGSDRNAFLYAFVKKDEFFWIRDFTTNIAGLATVTVSTESPSTGQLGVNAVDGFIEGYPGYQNWEWATNGELAGAWINLAWQNPATISQVVLYNRQTLVEDVLSGHLTFSDGSTVPVGQLPISGNPYLVSFPPKTVSSVQFTVDNAVGQNIGLTEIEVFGSAAGNSINNPQFFQGVLASASYNTDAFGQLLTPTITDAQSTNLNVVGFDVDAQPLNYAWTSDSGMITGSGASALFAPPVVSAPTVVTATVTVTDGQGGTAQNSGFITVTPSNTSGLSVSSLSVNPNNVQSGSTALGTVTLNAPAPQGAVVALSSANPAVAAVPPSVTVAPGASSATFPISTTYVVSSVTVNISATLGGVTQVDNVTVLQPPVIVSSVTFNPPTVGGGNPSTGTVLLTGPAQGDSVITLTNGSPSIITIPANVTVLNGTTSSTFPVTTRPVTTGTSAAVSAYFVGQTTNVTLRVAPYIAPNLATSATVTVSSQNTSTQQQGTKAIDGIVDGSPGDYTREWATLGQLAGAWIKLNWGLPVTASQVVLYDRPNLVDNVTSGTLSFSDGTTVPVGALPNDGSPLTVSFTPKTVTWMQFTVDSAVGQNIGLSEIAVIGTITQASAISAVSVMPASVTGGYGSTGTVTLNGVAPTGGTVVTLNSSDNSSATVPASVTVPAGSLSALFPITTYSVNSTTGVSISGTYNGAQSALLTVVPVGISSLTLNPNMVQGGIATSTGIVSLTGPAPPSGAVVSLTSNNSGAASVPATMTIPPGSASGTFTITTTSVAATVQVGISAYYNGAQAAPLLVAPVIYGGMMQQFSVDNFSRADGPLGPNWSTTLDSPSAPTIVGQQVQSPWVFSTALYYGGINWPADQYAQVQVLQSNNGSSGPAVRMTSNAYYAGTVGTLGAGNATVYIILNSGGNRSIIASSSTAIVLAGDYLQLTAQGTTLTLTDVTQSQALLTVSDSTISAGYPGLYVGGIVANWSAGLSSMPPILQTVATDNFNRHDSPNLGSNWTVGPGYYPIQIISTQIESDGQGQPPGQGHGKEYYTATTFPSDQWSQAQVIESTNDINGALVRYQGAVDTHYVGFVSMLGAPGTCSAAIDSDTLGSPSVLASDTHYCSVASGDYLRMQAQGPLLTLVDATTGSLLLAALDSGISGGWPGWSLNPIGGSPIAANWSGGQFSSQSQVLLSSLMLSPQSVLGGNTSTGTVMLNGPAPAGGALVTLTSSNVSVAQVPGSVTIAQGASTATFTVTTNAVQSNTPLTITATYGTTQSATLTVTAPATVLSSVSVAPSSVIGGTSSTGTVTLTGPAPSNGATVTLSSSNPSAAQVPPTVTVAAGMTTVTFTITTSPVASDTPVTIGGTDGASASVALTVAAAVLSNISVNPTSVVGGNFSTGTVILNGPAPSAGAAVTLSSSNTPAAQVPASVTVAAGATTAAFTITTGFVSNDTSVTISGIYGATQGASLTVTAITSTISGVISGPGGPGATVSLSGASMATTTADGSGSYAFMGLLNGSYQVTPSNPGYSFTPGTQAVTINNANVVANFASASQTYSISGTISGSGGPGATVVLTGSTTATTIADNSGNFTFTGLLNGSYIVTPGNTGYVFTSASADVVINGSNYTGLSYTTVSGCPTCDIVWGPSAVPTLADSGDPTSMELGVKIRADNDGYITGLRFYKAPNNTGTHVAHLWSSSGTLLGTVTITGESAAGWQQMLFATPVPVVANTTYVASYLAPAGHYSDDANFFATSGVDNAPLHALANGIDGPNGVFLATTTGGFPTSTNHSDDYWVDVVYTNTQGYSIVGAISGPGGAGATVNLTGAATASTTTDANGNFSFNNLANGSYTVTPINGSYTITPSSQSVTITSAHVMNMAFTSAVSTYSVSGTISGPGGPGATISLSGNSTATTTADGSGNYSFTGLSNGSYTVTPSNTGYAFTPASQPATVNGASITALNFTSAAQTYSLSGTISGSGGPGATVSLTGASTATTTADGSGNYSFNGLTNGNYTVTPSKSGFVFSPASQSTAVTNANITGFNFASSPTVASITVNPSSVIGGSTSTGTVTLTGPAPAGGAVVALSSSNIAAAQVPASVTVAANATTATFTVTTSPVASTTSLSISSTYNTTQSVGFTVTAAALSSVSVNPTSVIGGSTSTGTVTLNGPAPSGGAVITLSSGNTSAAQVPTSVTVTANSTTATFTVTTSAVTSNTSLTISGTYGTTQTAGFTVNAAVLSSVTLNPTSVPGGASSVGTVTLNGPAPTGGAVVTLSSSNTSVAQVPTSITVAANATTATFTVTTSVVASNTTVTITANRGATQTTNLIVMTGSLSSVTLNPTSVIGGVSSTGTITLAAVAPAGGAIVTLSSNNPGAAQVPASVTVAAGATTASFTVTTTPVSTNTAVTITGTYGVSRTASLTVNAPTLTGNGSGVTVSPSSVVGGTPSTGTVKLTGPAPTGGSVVTLSSNNVSAAEVPPSVTVPAGATTATFTVTTSPVASNASVTISGVYGVTRTASLTVTAAVLNSVTLNPTSVTGGNIATATVALTGPAPVGGAVVSLSSNNTAIAQVPATVTVAANATTATFTVTTSPVSTTVTPTISATYMTNRTAGLTVLANGVSSVVLSPTSVVGGTPSTGTVTLNRAAPTGGAVVTLSSNNISAAQVPASVTVPANATSATFTVTTSPVASNATVTITGTYLTAKTATVTVNAATANTLTVNPTSVMGGTSSTGTVTLTGPAPAGGAIVTLSSNNAATAQVPANVTVPANATTATFTITTTPVASNASVTITATLGVAKTAVLTVTAPTLTALTLNPTTVRGGIQSSTGTVTLSGPAPSGGAVVTLSSSLTSVATVPASVTVTAGNTTATFTVTTHTVSGTRTVTITGTKGTTQTAVLTVTP